MLGLILALCSAVHLKASNDDYSVNVELSDAQTDLLHELMWQRSL